MLHKVYEMKTFDELNLQLYSYKNTYYVPI